MDNRPVLIRQTIINYSNLVLTFIIGFLSVFTLTRVLSVEEYGVYSLLFTFGTIMGVFVNLGLAEYIVSQFGKFNAKGRAVRFSSLLNFSFASYLIICILLYAFRHSILNLLNIQGYVYEYTIVLAVIFNLALFRSISSFYQANKKLEYNAVLNFLNVNLGIIVFIAYYFLKGHLDIKIVFFSWLGAVILSNLAGLFRLRLKMGLPGKKIVWTALLFSLPLMPFLISDSLIIFGDRFIINYLLNTEEVAFYTLAYQLHSIIFSFGSLIFILFLPYVSELAHGKKEIKHYINYSVKYCLLMVLPAITLLSVMAENIVTLVSGVKYVYSAKIVLALALFPLLATLVVFLYYQAMIKGMTKFLGIVYTLVAVVSLSLSFLLVWIMKSAIGAAIATVITYLFLFIILSAKTGALSYLSMKFLRIGRIVLACIIAGAAVFFINPQTAAYKLASMVLFSAVYVLALFILNAFASDEWDVLNMVKKKILKQR